MSKMGFTDILKGIGKSLGNDFVDGLKEKVDDTLEDAKMRIEETTEMIIKKVLGISFVLIGIIFGLVGMSKYLSAAVDWMANGVGYIIVGMGLVLLGWFANYMSK